MINSGFVQFFKCQNVAILYRNAMAKPVRYLEQYVRYENADSIDDYSFIFYTCIDPYKQL
jgi:hypothetical protein